MQSVSHRFSGDLFGHNFAVLVSDSLKGRLDAHAGRLELFIVVKQGTHYIGVLYHQVIVRFLDVYL